MTESTGGSEKKEKGRLTFKKEERLHHLTLVEGLFRGGKSIYEFPLRLTWRQLNEEDLNSEFRHGIPPGIGKLQMMVSVPKKKRKRAVDRVLMRRRIREAYRLNRLPLKNMIENSSKTRTLSLAFIYLHDKNLDYALIRDKIKILLGRMLKTIEKSEKNRYEPNIHPAD